MATVLTDHIETLELEELDGVVVRVVRLFRVIDVSGTDYKVLTNALAANGVPDYEDKLSSPSSLGNLIVTKRDARLVDRDRKTVDVVVTYKRFDAGQAQDLDNPPIGVFLGSWGGSLQQVTSNIDRNDAVIEVTHTYPADDDNFPGETKTQAATIHYAQPNVTFTVSGRKATNRPWTIVMQLTSKTNASAWLGQPADYWLCTGISAEPVNTVGATTVWFFRIEFTMNPDGWQPQVVFRDEVTGRPPPDLEAGTGYKTVDRYQQANYEAILQQRFF